MSRDLRSIQSGKFELGPHTDLEIDSGFSNSLSNKESKISNDLSVVEELSVEYTMQLLELGNQKNALFQQQDEFLYLIQSQRLEEEQYQVEKEIRQLMEKPDSEKTEEDWQKEEELKMKRIDIVDQKKSIIDSIEMSRRRKENEKNESLVQKRSNKTGIDESEKENETQKNSNETKVLKRVGNSEKTEEDWQKEEELRMKRINIAAQKKAILDSIEMGSRRKENEKNESQMQDKSNKKGTGDSGKENETQKANSNGTKVLKRVGIFAAKTTLITGAVIGGTTLALPLIGFGSLGPIGGSLAALYQSSVLGGTIASGSAFATLQSVGMAGLSAAAQGAVCAGSAAVSGAHEVYHHVKSKKDKK